VKDNIRTGCEEMDIDPVRLILFARGGASATNFHYKLTFNSRKLGDHLIDLDLCTASQVESQTVFKIL
jgi:hypothetical protein